MSEPTKTKEGVVTFTPNPLRTTDCVSLSRPKARKKKAQIGKSAFSS
jgi:hypothetical protein